MNEVKIWEAITKITEGQRGDLERMDKVIDRIIAIENKQDEMDEALKLVMRNNAPYKPIDGDWDKFEAEQKAKRQEESDVDLTKDATDYEKK